MFLVAAGMITVGKIAVLPNPLKSRLMATKSTRMLHPLCWAITTSDLSRTSLNKRLACLQVLPVVDYEPGILQHGGR